MFLRKIKIMKRGDTLYEDKQSAVDAYLDCRDGIVNCVEYTDGSGYGSKTKLYLCENTKHESISIIRESAGIEETLNFDIDSFKFLLALLQGRTDELGGKFTTLRDYNSKK